MNYTDVQHLAELLRGSASDEDTNDDFNLKTLSQQGPADLLKKPEQIPSNSKENQNDRTIDVGDKLQPEFSFAYSQDVRAEDIFLQLGLRNPGSASCENLRITINMPEEDCNLNEIHADVDCNYLELKSPKYYLNLPLPHPVDKSTNKAQWDSIKRQLTVTIRLCRQLDFLNF